MFGPWAPNGYLLASIPPLGDIYIYFYPLARHVWALGSERLSCIESIIRPCGLAPSRQYSFGLAASVAPSRQNRFSIRLMADVVFITLPPPRSDISFAPHGANQFSLRLILPTQ
jgi:hypothetical protein